MRLTNTLTGKLEELEPLEPGHVRMYACGVTPYAESHVGHAFSAIIYDVLVRYLRWSGNRAGGYRVTYVSNYTDVDDKIIERANELGVDAADLATREIAAWEEQQRALNLLPPDVRPRVTTEIPAIIATIERIIANGYAYATAAGDVYYRVRSKPDYGKLSHRNIEELRSGTRGEPGDGKEFPLDFALWKSAKPGEPSWPSPWGAGRPGWHIECTAMSQRYLGETFDIHGGGVDLVFPHHENEIAQAEAATGKPFARVWLHNGLVQRDGEKMSKSLGNVVTVREALERWSPDAIRLFVLTGHYRSPSNLTDEAMAAATAATYILRTALHREPISDPPTSNFYLWDESRIDIDEHRRRFADAMEDDLNTPRAVATLRSLAKQVNQVIDARRPAADGQELLGELAGVLGLQLPPVRVSLSGSIPAPAGEVTTVVFRAKELAQIAREFGVACAGKDGHETARAIVEFRAAARAGGDYATADAIRRALRERADLEIEDGPTGTQIRQRE